MGLSWREYLLTDNGPRSLRAPWPGSVRAWPLVALLLAVASPAQGAMVEVVAVLALAVRVLAWNSRR